MKTTHAWQILAMLVSWNKERAFPTAFAPPGARNNSIKFIIRNLKKNQNVPTSKSYLAFLTL
jgi:hypothetical protein